MKTIKIDLPDQQAEALQAKAMAQGLTLEDWFRKVAEKEAASVSVAHLQKTNPEEWIRHFDAFLNSLDPNTPVLSDEATKRENIYPDRS
jgi:hypothetical protein